MAQTTHTATARSEGLSYASTVVTTTANGCAEGRFNLHSICTQQTTTASVGRRNASNSWSPGSGCQAQQHSAAAMTRTHQNASHAHKQRWIAHVDMSAIPVMSQAQPPSASQSSNDTLGEVQDILAERSSTTLGCSEVLVTWKPTWIPITNLQDGPILRKFRHTPKCRFQSSAGKLLLPVEPDTALADDMAAAADRNDRQQVLQTQQDRGTPRKLLGSVAKRAAPSARTDDSESKRP